MIKGQTYTENEVIEESDRRFEDETSLVAVNSTEVLVFLKLVDNKYRLERVYELKE